MTDSVLDETRDFWNRVADDWQIQVGDEGDANRQLNSDPVLWRFAGNVRGRAVLDAGCGTGYLSAQLRSAEGERRMPRLEGTRHILAVRNLRTATDFYVNALGFQRDFGDESDGWSWLSRDNFRVGLGECTDAVPARDLGDHSYVAYVNVDDIDALYAELVSRGAPIRVPPQTKPWGMREFGLQTPDGHRMTFGSTVK